MTQKDNILQELSELNSTLATIASQNVYAVPAGYFDGLIAQVLNRIKAMEAANAVEELGHLSPMLSNMSKQIPYVVPQGYFEGLAENAIQSVRESNDYHTAKEEMETLSPLLSSLKKEIPYSVPQGYFEGLTDKAMQSVHESNDNETAKEELATLSPLLSGLKKEMPFAVPQGYFESLTENISREENKPAVKVISITSRKWFRYAAAAVVTGIIAMVGFLIVKDKQNEEGQSIVKFEKKLNKEIKQMSDEELNDFIQFTDAGLTGEEKVSTKTTDEVKELLKDVPDTELKEFLEETSDVESDSGTSSMLN
jgi:hypothetical protein